MRFWLRKRVGFEFGFSDDHSGISGPTTAMLLLVNFTSSNKCKQRYETKVLRLDTYLAAMKLSKEFMKLSKEFVVDIPFK